MENSLKHKTVNGLAWNFINQFATKGIVFIFSILLARILMPEDYGLIAMLNIFIAVAQTFIDSGFSTAIIRKPDRTEEDLNTVFYFNIILSSICYIVLFFAAPYIAEFYNVPELVKITRVISLNLVIGSFAGIHSSILKIRLDFKAPAIISMTSAIVFSTFGLCLAYKGYGVWALIFQQLTSTAAGVVIMWIYVRWRPRLIFSWQSFRGLFGFGSKLLVSYLLNTIFGNLYTLVIGKFFTPAQLGLYSKANTFASFPSCNLSGVIQAVTFPVLSSIQQDEERLMAYYRKFLRLTAFAVFPIMIGLAAVADPLIRVLLTDKWEGAIVFLQIICFSLMWYPIHSINLNVLQVKGYSGYFLKLEIIKKLLTIFVLCVTIPLGLVAMCIGSVFSSIVCLPINTYYTKKILNYGFRDQMKDLVHIIIASLLMGLVVALVVLIIPQNLIALCCAIILGCAVYIIIAKIFHFEELENCTKLLREQIQK